MQYAAKTHVGLVRQLNEDSYATVMDRKPYGIAVVADGMGGHLAGEVASSLAIEAVVKHLQEHVAEGQDPSDQLVDAIQAANRVVFERASSSEGLSGMGTTVVAALFDAAHIYLCHIGDSRAYLLHAGALRQLTDDHTLVHELFKSGQITAEEAIHHPQRNIVTRAVGTDISVAADLSHWEWGQGDILLICSDGLTNMVEQEQMAAVLNSGESIEAKVDSLIQGALAAGGHDNITVVAIHNQGERGETR